MKLFIAPLVKIKVEIYLKPVVFMIHLLAAVNCLAFMIFCDERARGRWDEYNFVFHHCVVQARLIFTTEELERISHSETYIIRRAVPRSECVEDAPA